MKDTRTRGILNRVVRKGSPRITSESTGKDHTRKEAGETHSRQRGQRGKALGEKRAPHGGGTARASVPAGASEEESEGSGRTGATY